MLYLEDYVELIEHLPSDLRERFTEIREMDLQIQTKMESLNGQVKDFFDKCANKKGKLNESDQLYENIRNEYYKVLEDADEKVQLASQIYDLVDRHLRKLDQELSKFKMELEADNAGITEILEQRSLELDNPISQQRSSGRERKRPHSTQASSSSNISSLPTNNGSDAPPDKRIKLENPIDCDVPKPQTSTDGNNVNIMEKSFPAVFDGGLEVATSDQYENSEGSNDLPEPSITLPSVSYEQDSSLISHESNTRRTMTTKGSFENLVRADLSNRINDLDAGSLDSLDTSGEHISDSSLSSFGTAAQRPSRTKKQTSKAAAWVQERKQQAEARSEQKKKENIPSTSSTQDSADESGGVEVVGETPTNVEWSCDPNEPRYCICNQVSYGEMVGCDNEKCPIEWFHYGCVDLTEAPKGKWYCPQCTQTMKRRHKR